MCELCKKIKNSFEYAVLIVKMHEQDSLRLKHAQTARSSFSSISAYSTMEYSKPFTYPMFEPKVAFATPLKYFQNIFVNDEKLPASFSHGSTRAIFFIGKRLVLLSKSTAIHEGEPFFSSFLLMHFEPNEYSLEISPESRISISINAEKQVKNLLLEKMEKINIQFEFVQENLENKLLSKDNALRSSLFVNQFKRAGINPRAYLNSTDYMFDYICTAAHFSPHPYMLKICSELGYTNPKNFQLNVLDYFKMHSKRE